MPLALTGYEIGLLSVALVFIVFALVVALVVPRARPDFPARKLGAFVGVCIALFAAQMTAVFLLAELGEEERADAAGPTEPEPTQPEPQPTPTDTTEPTGTTGAEGDPVAGKEVFVSNCGTCHTLADAGTNGTVGPNLDASQPSYELAVDRVTNGQGVMPSFRDTLSEQQIRDVAAYVSTAAG